MAAKSQYVKLNNLLVYNSTIPTIEVKLDDTYNGAHRYRVRMAKGFNTKKQCIEYSKNTSVIQFIQKDTNGTFKEGFQSEQLVLILLDRIKKLNEVFPCEQNEKQIQALEMFLEACKERVDERLSRGVMGELKK